MKEYMTSVFVASSFFSILNHISFKSSLDGVRKFAFGILLITVVAAPVLGALGSLSDIDIEELIPDAEYGEEVDSELYETAFAEGIAEAVCEKFELKRGEVRVLTEGFLPSEWRCDKIRIILSGSAAFADYRKIEKYINGMEIGECEAEIEIG